MADADRVSAELAAIPDPALIWLGRKGRTHGHDLAWYERRHGEPVPADARAAAAEIAPGVWVKLLSTGGHYCEQFRAETWGGLAAVWDERALAGDDGSDD